MHDDYILGDTVLFYINTADGWLPVCSITNTPLTRTTGQIETSSRGSGGNRSYLPTMHDYTAGFDGILTKAEGVVSYDHLDQLQGNRVIFDWRILSNDGYITKTGSAFINTLTLNTEVRTWASFSCSLAPAKGGMGDILLWSQDGFNVVSQNGENLIQIK